MQWYLAGSSSFSFLVGGFGFSGKAVSTFKLRDAREEDALALLVPLAGSVVALDLAHVTPPRTASGRRRGSSPS